MLDDGVTTVELSKRAYCKNELYGKETRCCFASGNSLDESRLFCCECAHKRRASPLSCLAVCALVLAYNLLGAFMFLAIEGNLHSVTGSSTDSEETSVAAVKPNLSSPQPLTLHLRSKTVERLWSITEDLNILYKENWTKLAAKELMDFQKVLIKSIKGASDASSSLDAGDYRWTFSTSFLYALTLITTIGHGNVTPKSTVGKMAAIAYACVGIPIIMLYLSTVGEALSRGLRALYTRARPASLPPRPPRPPRFTRTHTHYCDKEDVYEQERRTPFQAALNLDSFNGGYHWSCRGHARVPALVSVLVMTLYIALGAALFHRTERWSLLDGCYFSFSSLATIGMGALRPGSHASTLSARAEDLAVGICCLYILVGIVVIAMCFNLIQEDLGGALRNVTVLCAGSKSRVIHAEPAAAAAGVCEDRRALAVVS